MKPALLVVDMQKAYFNPRTRASLDSAIEGINAAIALFRARDLPVVCIQDISADGTVAPETEGFAVAEALAILPSDPHIHKTYRNAFHGTALADTLRQRGVDTVIITGYCAEQCVLSTCRGAEDVDLAAIILRGAIAGGVPEHIAFVERVNESISYGALKAMLD